MKAYIIKRGDMHLISLSKRSLAWSSDRSEAKAYKKFLKACKVASKIAESTEVVQVELVIDPTSESVVVFISPK